MCAEIYAAYDRKMDLEAQGIYGELTMCTELCVREN